MQQVDYMAIANEAMRQIKPGAFLTVDNGQARNTMTIGWATIGYVWKAPIMMVAVRDSRHTFGIIEKSSDFTVSIPSGDLKKELAFCGSRSGREYDKFKECDLATAPGQKVKSPIIDIPGYHYECRIMFKQAMDPALLEESFHSLYPKKDFHTLYFGEIVYCGKK
jgi:flavin reductase (DIM6/NTAB) family NADH-FMN oxidoreductase RutF